MNLDTKLKWFDNEQNLEYGTSVFVKLSAGETTILFMSEGEIVETRFLDSAGKKQMAVRFNPVFLVDDDGIQGDFPKIFEVTHPKLLDLLRKFHNKVGTLKQQMITITLTKNGKYNNYEMNPMYANLDNFPSSDPVTFEDKEE